MNRHTAFLALGLWAAAVVAVAGPAGAQEVDPAPTTTATTVPAPTTTEAPETTVPETTGPPAGTRPPASRPPATTAPPASRLPAPDRSAADPGPPGRGSAPAVREAPGSPANTTGTSTTVPGTPGVPAPSPQVTPAGQPAVADRLGNILLGAGLIVFGLGMAGVAIPVRSIERKRASKS